MKTRGWLLPFAFLAAVSMPVAAQNLNLDRVYALLMKVAEAPNQVAYHGTVRTVSVNTRGTRTVVVKIEHGTNGEDRVTILQPSQDAGRVFVRNAKEGAMHDGGGPLSLGLSGVKSRVGSDLALLLSNYSLKASDGGIIAGRETYHIEILPKYPDRKSKQIWVDRRTGIVLKSVVNRPVDGVVDTTEFTAIELSPNMWTLPDSGMQPLELPKQEARGVNTGTKWIGVIDKAELATLSSIERKEGFKLLSPSYLPAGFAMEEVRDFPSPTNSQRRVVHILYSDGLSSISLFLQQEEPLWPDKVRSFFFGGGRRDGNSRHHPDEHGVAVVEGSQNGTRYVLVSDVATDTLKKMADSLAPIK